MGRSTSYSSRGQTEEDLRNEARWLEGLPKGSKAYDNTVRNITTLIGRVEDPLPGED